jgi:hypothetical protein
VPVQLLPWVANVMVQVKLLAGSAHDCEHGRAVWDILQQMPTSSCCSTCQLRVWQSGWLVGVRAHLWNCFTPSRETVSSHIITRWGRFIRGSRSAIMSGV